MASAESAAQIAQLLKLARRGDADAFGELVVRFGPAVRATCLMRAADPHRADDLSQQVFLTAWRRLADLRDDAQFWPWLEAITRNHLLNEWRRVQRERGLKQRYAVAWLAANESELPGPAAAEEIAQEVETLRDCVNRLPENLQRLVQLRYHEGQTSQQIAVELGRSPDAVRQILLRVRDRLRECIERKLSRGSV